MHRIWGAIELDDSSSLEHSTELQDAQRKAVVDAQRLGGVEFLEETPTDGDTAEDGGRGVAEAPVRYSRGSELHASGACKPCNFFHKPGGCSSGQACEFCHFFHAPKSRPPQGMRKR